MRILQAASRLLLVAAIPGLACSQTSPIGPVNLTPPISTQPPAPAQLVVSEWHGSSQVSSADSLPACVPGFWQTGFVDSISWQFVKSKNYLRDQFDLQLRQEASGEFCHLNATITGSSVAAGPWDDNGIGSEGETWCHFQLPTSNWTCHDKAPEVWIAGINVTGSFTDSSQDRIQGIMEVNYSHRPGSGSYITGTIRKSFDVVKTSR